MTGTVHQHAEGVYYAVSTVDLVRATVEVLRDAGLVLNDGDTDYAAADMLEVLVLMHDETGIDLEKLVEVRSFAIAILDGRWTP